MKKAGFFTNKYTISVFILLACLVTDIILHRSMSRGIIPSTFTDKRKPQNFTNCNTQLLLQSKHWLKGVDKVDIFEKVPAETAGFEWVMNFDTAAKTFTTVNAGTTITIDTLLSIYQQRKLSASVWLDIINLSNQNNASALAALSSIRKRYNLLHKIIVASASPEHLKNYCDSGFYTSYVIPEFNPYNLKEDSLVYYIDYIAAALKKNAVSSIAGDYFQYPVLKKYFPNMPVLTWTDKSNISLVSRLFNFRMENDAQIKVVLYPY